MAIKRTAKKENNINGRINNNCGEHDKYIVNSTVLIRSEHLIKEKNKGQHLLVSEKTRQEGDF